MRKHRVGGSFAVDQPVALDHMQRITVRRAVTVKHRPSAGLDARGINDQRVAFIVANRISDIGWDQRIRVRRIQPHVAYLLIVRIDQHNFVGTLQHQQLQLD